MRNKENEKDSLLEVEVGGKRMDFEIEAKEKFLSEENQSLLQK